MIDPSGLPCPDCDGRGGVEYTDLECEDAEHHDHGHMRECETCGGTGAVGFARHCAHCDDSGALAAVGTLVVTCGCARGRALQLATRHNASSK